MNVTVTIIQNDLYNTTTYINNSDKKIRLFTKGEGYQMNFVLSEGSSLVLPAQYLGEIYVEELK